MAFINPGFTTNRRMRNMVSPWSSMIGGNLGNIGSGKTYIQPGFYDINPFESNVIDVFDPFKYVDQILNRAMRFIDQPGVRSSIGQPLSRSRSIKKLLTQPLQQQQQQKRSRSQKSETGLTSQMPQKYRISVNCTNIDPSSICTQIKDVQNQKHLILTSKNKRGGMTFKRSFTLPSNVKPNKLNTYIGPNNQFICEFPFAETPISLDLDLNPIIVGSGKNKMVIIEERLPEFINPMTVSVVVKGHELIIRFESQTTKPDSISRAYYYNRVTLPINCDLDQIHCVQKKRWLTIRVPVVTETSSGFRNVPIHRKLRHRLLEKLQSDQQQQKLSIKRPQGQQQQQNKQKQQMSSKVGVWDQSPQTQKQQTQSFKTQQQMNKLTAKKQQQQGNIGTSQQKQVKSDTFQQHGQRRVGSNILHELFGSAQNQQDWQQTGSGMTEQENRKNKQLVGSEWQQQKKQTSDIAKNQQFTSAQQQSQDKNISKNKMKGLGGADIGGSQKMSQSESDINKSNKKQMKNQSDTSSSLDSGRECSSCGVVSGEREKSTQFNSQSDTGLQNKNNNSPKSSKSNLRSSPTGSNTNLQSRNP